jgi:hypothetical protein
MTTRQHRDSDCYTVICRHRCGDEAGDDWQLVTVVIRGAVDAQDAADNAGLFLIWDRQGQADPVLVFEGNPKLVDVFGGIFDAQEFDETITFVGEIVSVQG